MLSKAWHSGLAPLLLAVLTLPALALNGCAGDEQPQTQFITLATTTSMQDSGMLEQLLPRFEEQTGIAVRVVAVGSGQALELGRRGDADVLITHSPAAERKFVEEGAGVGRRPIMQNDFVVVGPVGDPAQVSAAKSAVEAFRRIAESESLFVSRGDDSGTHKRELETWKQAGIEPEQTWYLEAGVGMAQALRMAAEKRAYTLTDRGTFLALPKHLDLRILHSGDPALINVYSVILIPPGRHPQEKSQAAKQFADFLVLPETRQLISQYGVEQFGEPLFRVAE